MTYQPKIHSEDGGDKQVVESGGSIDVKTGGAITSDGTQASAISDITVTGTYSTDDSAIETAVNSILAALRGAGIVASA